jgi:hypothetical protein
MRKRFEQQLSLGIVPIPDFKISLKSRHELPPILVGLQHIFTAPALNAAVFELLERRICDGKRNTGRPGMDLWQILVLGVVRLGTDSNWDALHHFANNDRSLRGILGVSTTAFCDEEEDFAYQTMIDNVSLLDEDTIKEISALVVAEGHRILKKKRDQGLAVKVDTFVLEADIHWPTDTGLVWDAARKCLDCMEFFSAKFDVPGWRKTRDWRRRLKSAARSVGQACKSKGAGKEGRVAAAAGAFLRIACELEDKLAVQMPLLADLVDVYEVPEKYRKVFYYHWFLVRQTDLVSRRLIYGEEIPQCEKLYSVFEPLVEWISKGKAGKLVEFGHNILIVTDQYNFIIDHQVVERTADVNLVLPLMARLREMYGEIRSASFDKGFYSKENKQELKELVPMLVMPKKGKLNEAEREEEGAKGFKSLRNKHSAVESNINQLEHNGLNKCPDRGTDAFKRYAALGVLSYNLHKLGKAIQEAERKRQRRAMEKALQNAA